MDNFQFRGEFVNSSFYQFALAGNKNIEIRCVFFCFWVTFKIRNLTGKNDIQQSDYCYQSKKKRHKFSQAVTDDDIALANLGFHHQLNNRLHSFILM